MNNELREAAERLADCVGDYGYMTGNACFDAEKVAKEYLAEHLPDDNEPVDKAWLRSILIEGGEFQYHDQMPDFLNLYNDEFDIGMESLKDKAITRGQVRLLLRALA